MWYCKNNFKKRGTNFINSKHAYYDKSCVTVFARYSGFKDLAASFLFWKAFARYSGFKFPLLESSVQFFIKSILYLSALVIENLRVNGIFGKF